MVRRRIDSARTWAAWAALALLSGCAGTVPVRETVAPRAPEPGHLVVLRAQELLGAPYRYGGAGPDGFDCSGLVYYVYGQIGVRVPRRTSEQFAKARPVALSELRPGDLVFFRVSKEKVSHVGIYVDAGRFIHAPSRGKPVGFGSIEDRYWSTRLVAAGRIL